MDLGLINLIFSLIHGFVVLMFGQRQLLRIHNIGRLKKLLNQPSAKRKVIHKKLAELTDANRKLEMIGHCVLALVTVAHFITLYFNFYQRFKFWYGILIIWGVAALFLRIAFWLKGATIISHIDVDEDGGDFFL